MRKALLSPYVVKKPIRWSIAERGDETIGAYGMLVCESER